MIVARLAAHVSKIHQDLPHQQLKPQPELWSSALMKTLRGLPCLTMNSETIFDVPMHC